MYVLYHESADNKVKTYKQTMSEKSTNSSFVILLSIAACSIGLVALILVTQWATNPKDPTDETYLGIPTTLMGYPGSENVFAWHPVLMVGGFFVGQILAINTWGIIPDHTASKIIHVLWQCAALGCMIAGLTAVVKEKFNEKSPSLTTMHSWIGVCGIVMYGKLLYIIYKNNIYMMISNLFL